MAVFNQVAAVGSKVPTEWMANGDPGINFFARPTGRTLALGDSRADVAASNAACDVSSASLSFILDGRKDDGKPPPERQDRFGRQWRSSWTMRRMRRIR